MKRPTYKNIMIGLVIALSAMISRFLFDRAMSFYKRKNTAKTNETIYEKANDKVLALSSAETSPGTYYTYIASSDTLESGTADNPGDQDNDGIVDAINITFDNEREAMFYPYIDYDEALNYERYGDYYGGYGGLVGLSFNYEVEDPVIRFFKYDESDTSMYYYATMKITNTGSSNLYVSDDSEFVLYADGIQIDAANYLSCTSNVILPGESAYIYMSYSRYVSSAYSEDELSVTPYYVIKTTIDTPLTYAVSNLTLKTDQYDDIELEGEVTNLTKQAADYLKITAILYDKDDNVLAIRQSYDVDELDVGETEDFEVEFYDQTFTRDDVAHYEVIATNYYYAY